LNPGEQKEGLHINSEAYENCMPHLWTSMNVFSIILSSFLTSLENVTGSKGKH